MAAKETGELKEAKEKLEMRVEHLTWRWQVEKRLRIYLQEAKAQEIAKLQDALYAMQIQVEEANSRDPKEREAAAQIAIEEAPPVVKDTPDLFQYAEKFDSLTAVVENLRDALYAMQIQVEEANSRDHKERVEVAAQIAIEEAPPVVKDTPDLFQYAEKFDSLTVVVENLRAMLLSEREAAEESRKVCIDAEVRIADVAKKMEDTVQKVDQLQDLVQRLADKLSYSESENQVLRQQARTPFIDEQQGGPTPALMIKAEVAWLVQSENLSEKEIVLKTVERILNKLTPEKFDLLRGQLIDSGITTADILKGVVSLIYEKAVLEPIFCPMYAQLCSDLHKKLPSFPSDEPDGKQITFRRVLLNNCQEAFDGADKLRTEVRQMYAPEYEVEHMDKERRVELRILGNIRFIGELVKQKMFHKRTVHRMILELLGADNKSCRSEENVEAICLFFNTIGKQLDESPKSRHVNDLYFDRLKELSKNPRLAPHLRFMICDVLDVRANNWV